VAYLQDDLMVIANVGDSRAVLCRGGRTLELSEDHKPGRPDERRRIELAGGEVRRDRYTFFDKRDPPLRAAWQTARLASAANPARARAAPVFRIAAALSP